MISSAYYSALLRRRILGCHGIGDEGHTAAKNNETRFCLFPLPPKPRRIGLMVVPSLLDSYC
jgi:hypothetical protein